MLLLSVELTVCWVKRVFSSPLVSTLLPQKLKESITIDVDDNLVVNQKVCCPHCLLAPFVVLAEIIPLLVTSRKELVFIDLFKLDCFPNRVEKGKWGKRGKRVGQWFPFSCFSYDIEQSRISRIPHHCTSGANICYHGRTVNVGSGTYDLTRHSGSTLSHRNGTHIEYASTAESLLTKKNPQVASEKLRWRLLEDVFEVTVCTHAD